MPHARTSLLFISALCAAMATCAHANDDLDTSWNGTGTLSMPVQGLDVRAGGVTVQPDGRILLAGLCQGPGDGPGNPFFTICMARLLPSGVRDLSFGPDQTGVFAFSQFPSFAPANAWYGASPHALLRQADGKIVVAGDTTDIVGNAGYRAMVARLLADGTLDPSVAQPVIFEFAHNDANPQSSIVAAAQQADGKIVVAGMATTTSNGIDAAVLRLNADGTPDDTFGNQGRASFDFHGHHADDKIWDVKVDGAGRIWLAGAYGFTSTTDSDFVVARLRADGSLDTSFCNGDGYRTVAFDLDEETTGVMTDEAERLLLQPDDKVVLIGRASNGAAVGTLSGTGFDFAAARLQQADCGLDSTFGADGKMHGRFGEQPFSFATDASLGGSGLVLAGYASSNEDSQFGVAMIRIDKIFASGFDP